MIVGRRAYLDAMQRVATLERELREERTRYTALVEKVTAMQRQGFRQPDPAPTTIPQPPSLPGVVVQAITEKMDPRGQAARQTAAMARLWLDQGDDPEAVAAKIRVGAEPPEEG